MKKQTILSKSIAAMAALALCVTAANAATLVNGTTGAGELFVGFHATSGIGSGLSVVIDLGSVSTLSSAAAGSTFNLGTYGQDLVNTFGATWYDRTDLSWGATAGVFSTATADPTNTVYGSAAVASYNPSALPTTTPYIRGTNSTQAPIAQRILTSMATGAGGFTSATTGVTGSNVGLEGTNDAQSWKSWVIGGANVSGFGNTPFGYFNNPAGSAQNFEQAFSAGSIGNGAEGALDVYRLQRTGTTDPENGLTTGNGTYQFTLSIGQSGQIGAAVEPVIAAVPEPASIGALTSFALLSIGAMRRKRSVRA